MTSSAKTIALVGKYNAPGITESIIELANFLESAGHTVVFESETALNMELQDFNIMAAPEIGKQADAAIVIGGDGTMLGIARQLAP